MGKGQIFRSYFGCFFIFHLNRFGDTTVDNGAKTTILLFYYSTTAIGGIHALYLGLLSPNHLMSGPPRLLVMRLIGHCHLAGFHHALGGRHLDAARQHSGFAQDTRGHRVPARLRAPVHLLRLVIGAGHLGGQVPFGVHGLQVAHIVVGLASALHEQSAAARSGGRRRRRRRHLLRGFREPVHGGGER